MRPASTRIHVLALAVLPALLVAAAPHPPPAPAPSPSAWEPLAAGLDLGTFAGAYASTHGDSKVRVLRIDPAGWSLRLLNASRPGEGEWRTIRDWVTRAGGVAGINASMFASNGRSVALMRTGGHVNNAVRSKDNAILAFDPRSPGEPPVRIVDRTCEDAPGLMARYDSLVQSIRMLDCDGKTTWAKQPRAWSTAAIGLDGSGRVLFVHARSPYPVHDLVEGLRRLPLGLVRLQYAEGGPEATLYVKVGGREVELLGSYETGFHESDDNARAWPVPNVVVVVPKP